MRGFHVYIFMIFMKNLINIACVLCTSGGCVLFTSILYAHRVFHVCSLLRIFDLSDTCGNCGRRYSTVEYYCVCSVFLAAITVMQFIVPLCFCYSNCYVFFTLTGFADLDLQVNAFLRGEFS